ncbi:MAG: GGDEF domain-containing protein [Alphaproteobacteria bacterium]|nr:GGDEF domain-containing protein [Alphaproteobacteria bacterium]
MDGASITFGAFLATAAIFVMITLALFPVVRRPFLLWLSARTAMIGLMALMFMSPQLPIGLSEGEAKLIGGVANTLSIAVAGPFLASYIERRYLLDRTRRLLRAVLPIGLILAGIIPLVPHAPILTNVPEMGLLVLIAIIVFGLARAISVGSRAATFQAVAWSGGVAVGIYLLVHEIVTGVEVDFWTTAVLAALVLEFIVTSMGVVDGFMDFRRQRDAALEEVEAATLAIATDPLTGLANRRGLLRHYEEGKRGRPHGVALIDCDHFKRINDRYGHDVGDEVLIAIGRGLKGENVFAARLGGEEFVVLLYGEDWQSLAEKARRRVTSAVIEDVSGLATTVTASAGIAQLREGESLASAMKRADRALYAAKDAGRDRSLAMIPFDARPPGDPASPQLRVVG